MDRLKIPEIVKRHRMASSLAGAALLLGGAEVAGFATNPTASVPEGACQSPFAKTPSYVDHGGNPIKTNAGIGEGVVVHITVPDRAEGVVAGWSDSGKDRWTTSDMIPATGSVALKFGVGQGDVEFGVRTVSQNPADCAQPPAIDVEYHKATSYFNAPGQIAWPNGVNNVVGLTQYFTP